MVSREGARCGCPVASGFIFAVNVDLRGAAGASRDAYYPALLASMQARQPSQAWHSMSEEAKQVREARARCGWHRSTVSCAETKLHQCVL